MMVRESLDGGGMRRERYGEGMESKDIGGASYLAFYELSRLMQQPLWHLRV